MRTFSRPVLAALLGVVLVGLVELLTTIKPSAVPTPVITTPSPAPTATASISADWKSFTNTSFGYSLKYPVDLEFIEEYTALETSDQVALAYKPGTADFEVHFGLKAVYPGYLDNLPTVKEALAANDLQKFATYLWDSNKNDINPETQGRTVGDLKKVQIGNHEAYTFTVTKFITVGKGEAKNIDGSTNYTVGNWQEFKREQQVTVIAGNGKFFITHYPAAYTEGQEILRSITFQQ